MRKLQVILAENEYHNRVVDAQTGERIGNVFSLAITIDQRSKFRPLVHLTLTDVEIIHEGTSEPQGEPTEPLPEEPESPFMGNAS